MARIGEKALPWVGAAAPIDASRPPRVHAIAGGLYCTLSLPLTVSLPVHVNGCFDLDDSRGHLTSRAKDNAAPHGLRAEWNRALLSEGCAAAWIALLKALVPDDPAGFHELWPDPGLPHDPLMKALVDGFYALARTEPLIRTRQQGRIRWATAAELRILPEEASPSLVAALLADGLALPEPPLPPGMRRGLAPALLTPGDLRELLRETPEFDGPVADAPRASLRRPEWIEAMLAYCASDRQNDLQDLPLALAGAGTLRAFGPRSRKWIFMPARETQALLSRLPGLFLAPELARHVAPAPDAALYVMSADHVAGFLKHVVGEVPRDWRPDASEPPNSAWLAALFRYFAGHDLTPESLTKLRTCALLPGHDGRLHPAASQPPVLAPAGAPKELLRRLRELGVVLAASPDATIDAFQAVLQRHPQFAARVTPTTVIGALASRLDAVARLERDAAIELLEWLARVELTSADLETLKTIPLLPTRAGLRRAKDRGVFLPAGFEVPALGTSVDLVDVPKTCTSLVARLGVEALHAPKFVAEMLLPALPAATPDERAAIWSWLRDNLEPILERMERPAADRLRGRVAQAPAFPATDGELHAVAELYDPDSELVRDVLAARALLPDPGFVRRERPRWHRFLLSLGLAAAPRLQDVVDHLLALCDEGLTAAPAIRRVFEYLQKEWNALQGAVVRIADQRVLLAALLKRKAWLPPLLTHASPGFVAPEPRLYRPQELHIDVELVGSQAPVCAWRVAAELADALGLRRIPPTSLVIAHFEHLLENAPTADDPETLARHAVALNPIYQHLKRLAEPAKRPGAPVLSAEERSTLVRFRDRACLWDLERRRLWCPSEVFVEPVLYFEPLRTSLQLKVAPDVVLLLGGKQRPDADDFRDFLVALAAEVGSGTLSPPQRWQVLHALGRIVGASQLDDVPLLCTDDGMRPASAVFIDDAPWLLERPHDLHYVSPEVPIAVLTALGVPRISQALTEQLQSVETRDVAPETLAACETVQARLRTPEFASGVQRLVRHLHGPASEPDLTFLTELRLTAVSRIRTRLVLRGKELTCVDARHFFQTHDLTLLLTGPSEHRLVPHVARTIQRLLGDDFRLGDTAPLEHILLCEEGSIHEMLNEDRISHVRYEDVQSLSPFLQLDGESPPANEGTLGEGTDATEEEDTDATEEEEEEEDQTGYDREPGDVKPPQVVDLPARNSGVSALSSAPLVGAGPPAPTPGRTTPPRSAEKSSAPTTPARSPALGSFAAGTWGADPALQGKLRQVASALDNPTPRPAPSQEPPAALSVPRLDARPQGIQPGLRTRASGDEPDEQLTREIEDQAIELVMAKEIAAKRDPERVPRDTRGYNILSRDRTSGEVVRLIEVKGTRRDWREQPVRLTIAQLKQALSTPNLSWLYVVERLAGKPRIHRIANPAAHIVGFSVDAASWAPLAEDAPAPTEPAEGLEVWSGEERLGTIVAVKTQGSLSILELRQADGRHVKKPYRPSEHSLRRSPDGEDGP